MTHVVDWLDIRAKSHPHKHALVDTITNRRISYFEWNQQANQTANYFLDLEIEVGDRVAVLASNCVEYLDILFACNKTGAILQNLNWRLAVPELISILANAQAGTLIYSAEFCETVKQLQASPVVSKSVKRWVALEERANETDLAFKVRDNFTTELTRSFDLPGSTPWVICYTGGTTGVPKGVIQTHDNVVWNASNTLNCGMLREDDSAIINLPMFHAGGLHVFTTPLAQVGGTSIICKAFDVDQIYSLIENERVSLMVGVPTIFQMMQQHPKWETADFSGLRYIGSGGANCPDRIIQKFQEKNAPFTLGYGLTEAGPNNFFLPFEMQYEKAGTVGYPLFFVDTKLIDDEGEKIESANQPGELLIRGPHVTPGYWNNPQATAEAIDEDEWLHTGDIAVFDDDGVFTILGRKKDMYISGGENIYPGEIESILINHPLVAECAVFSIDDEIWGEVGCAALVTKDKAKLEDADFANFLKGKIANFKFPKKYLIVDAIPKTAMGKINKSELRQTLMP